MADKYATILDQGVVVSQQKNVLGYNAWPSIARDANGDLVMACSGNRVMHVCPFGKVMLYKSQDEGKTWSAPSIAVDTPLDDRDAGILNLGNGSMMVSTFNNTRQMQSDYADGGKYGETKRIALVRAYLPLITDEMEKEYYGSLISISRNNGFSWEAPFTVPITAPHGPNLLKGGGVVYAGTPFPSTPVDAQFPIAVYKSDDYETFYKLADIPNCPQLTNCQYSEPHIIELPDGTLVLHIRIDELDKRYEDRIFTIVQSVSHDGGKTWSVPALTGATGSPPHLFLHSSGTLISIYGRRTPTFGIQAMFSTDGAVTWDTDYFVWDQGLDVDLGYPATTELDNGDLFTVFYAKQKLSELCSILWVRWRLPK